MIKLEFTVEQMNELVNQGDASWMNGKRDNFQLAFIGGELYKKEDNIYYNVSQRIRHSKDIKPKGLYTG